MSGLDRDRRAGSARPAPRPRRAVRRSIRAPSRIHLAAFPPTERWDDWVEWDAKAWPRRLRAAIGWCRPSASTARRPAACWPTSTRHAARSGSSRATRAHPGSRGRNCAKGPATLTRSRSRAHPLAAQTRGRSRRGPMEAHHLGRGAGRDRGRMRRAIAAATASCITWGARARTATPSVSGPLGRRRSQQPHQRLLARRSGRLHFWTGFDRPSPDHANARVILLIRHLETGHYFNPHAQRIIEAKLRGRAHRHLDPRLSNTASRSDLWLPTWPGSEPTVLLAIARHLCRPIATTGISCAAGSTGGNSWRQRSSTPTAPRPASGLRGAFSCALGLFSFTFDARRSPGAAGAHRGGGRAGRGVVKGGWRRTCGVRPRRQSGRLAGGALPVPAERADRHLGSPGGTYGNAWNKLVPRPFHSPPPDAWNALHFPDEWPLACYEMSFLLPHLREGPGRSTCISRASTTRCGRIPTASPGWRR